MLCVCVCAGAGDAVSVSASALGALVSEDGGDLPVEIMEALIEAEKLNGVAKRAEEAASATARARRWRSRVCEQGPGSFSHVPCEYSATNSLFCVFAAAGAGGEEFEDDFVDEEEFPVGSDENVEHAVPSAASEGESMIFQRI